MVSAESFVPGLEEIKVDHMSESRISNVVAMLPSSLQSRMGPIRFLRRSISLNTLRPALCEPPVNIRPLSEADVPVLAQRGLVTELLDDKESCPDTDTKAPCLRPIRKVLYSESTDDDKAVRAASGVHWKFARQGTSLVNIAIDGGKPAVADEDVVFERKAYLDGVTYLLKGLPRDMDMCELRRIQSALPEDAVRVHLDGSVAQIGSSYGRLGEPRSILHRGVQMTVVNIIMILSFLMPYLMYMLRYAARLERKYKVSETLVGHCLDFMNSISKQSASLTESMYQMNDGKVGQAVLEAMIWTVDGIAQGVSDGVGEGLSIVGARSSGM